FRAGTPARRGAVLVAGTGAVAAVVDGDAVVRRAGGHGWLVGDEGSAVWLGIRGVRAVLHALDGRGPATSLTTAFVEAIGIDADADPETLARALVDHVYAHPPADLGRLARPVVDACAAGDAVASELVRDAAVELTGTLAAVVDHTISVVVLAGSLLTDAAPLADLVRSEVRRRWRETTITTTRSGAPGAVALAIELHTGAPPNETVLASLRSAGNTDRPPA
ncbi:MAG TPA: N-acetylglucosamine kinase, partial [Actinobacteria bacterium]|nr:N-acetylglucosamine kinase [Actinomycetota bacterium]